MYKNITKDDIYNNDYSDYKLCYIDTVPETYSDWDEDTKKLVESEEYKKWQKEFEEYRKKETAEGHSLSYNPVYDNPYWDLMHMKEYPNPEFEHGRYKAYFTPLPLDQQWGDDWNDAPLECNAGIPYDDVIDEVKDVDGLKIVSKKHDIEILTVIFDADCRFPWSYEYNSPFCVEDVNKQAVAWMYDGKNTILAGVNPKEFIKKLEKFNK
jgi:hypothetical protein